MLEAVPAARIGCIQVNDGALVPEHDDYFTDNISNRRVLGQGEFDLSRFFALLKEKQLDVPESVEVISTALQAQPSADVAQQLHASLMRYYSA